MRRPAREVILAPFVLALLALTIPTTEAEPPATPEPTAEPTPTPEPTYPPLVAAPTVGGPELVLYVAPTPAPKVPLGAPRYGRCLSPSVSTDRRRGNSPAAQSYLRSHLNRYEYACAWWIVLQESGWRPTALNYRSGACGFPQAYPCSRLANFIAARHPDTCKPTKLPGLIVTWACDWRQYPNDQIDWLLWYVHSKYGTFLQAATVKFGYVDSAGYHKGIGWY